MMQSIYLGLEAALLAATRPRLVEHSSVRLVVYNVAWRL